ncbi:MAG: hypothetical protein NVSMB63_20050 [Sediminibacterium sp.]
MNIQHLQPSMVDTDSYLTILAEKAGRLVLKVRDADGRIAKTVETMVDAGNQELPLNMSDLATGRYILNAFCGGVFIKAIKFVKQ